MRPLLCLVCLGMSFALRTPRLAEPRTIAARGSFFALAVDDLARSSAWYRNSFSLRTTMTIPKSRTSARGEVLEGDGLIVELLQTSGDKAAAATPGPDASHGIFKVGLLVSNIAATTAELRARGVDVAYGPYAAHDGQRANVIVRDDSGNLIQLLEMSGK